MSSEKVILASYLEKKHVISKPKYPYGFTTGLEAKKILGTTLVDDDITLHSKWKNVDEPELVYAREANEKTLRW